MYTHTQVENILNKIDVAYILQTGNWLPAPCHPHPHISIDKHSPLKSTLKSD